MSKLMRCQYCGILQDEPVGAKVCVNCGGELAFETGPRPNERDSYLKVQMELDQVMAPAGQNLERHLILTLRTPSEVPSAHRAPVQAGRPPLNLAAVLDVSGSMGGEKLVQAKNALRQAVDRLVDGDVFSLVSFSTEVRCLFQPAIVNAEMRRLVVSAIQEITTQDMTNLCGGLELGLEKASQNRQGTNLVLLLSDGLTNIGITDLDAIAERAHAGRRKGITVSTIGVGLDYNEALMVALADQGGGRFCHVEKATELTRFLTEELGDVAYAAAKATEIHLILPSGAVLSGFASAYPIQQNGQTALITVGDIPCNTELEVPLAVALQAQSSGVKLSFEGTVEYRSPAGKYLKSTLNRVTLRVVDASAFKLRDGVAVPVAERVLDHLKASNVLHVSRVLRQSPVQAPQQERLRVDKVRSYARLLGDERANEETNEMETDFGALHASPSSLKHAVADAHYRQRNPKRRES